MKNLFLLLLLLSCLSPEAQTISRDLYVLTLPKGSEKITRAQIPAERDSFEHVAMKMGSLGELYKVGTTTYIQLVPFKNEKPQFEPVNMKRMADIAQKAQKVSLPNYSNSLKAINNFNVFVETYNLQNNSYYRFHSRSIKAPYFLNGMIEFKERDRTKVRAMMYAMLETLRFRNESYKPEVKVKQTKGRR